MSKSNLCIKYFSLWWCIACGMQLHSNYISIYLPILSDTSDVKPPYKKTLTHIQMPISIKNMTFPYIIEFSELFVVLYSTYFWYWLWKMRFYLRLCIKIIHPLCLNNSSDLFSHFCLPPVWNMIGLLDGTQGDGDLSWCSRAIN